MIRLAPFDTGRDLQYQGMRWTVLRTTGRTVTLQSHLGATHEFDAVDVVTDPTYYPHLRPDEYTPGERHFLQTITPEERTTLLEKEACIQEILTGYRSGRADTPGRHEPRPGFDPSTTKLTDRYAAAALEMDCGVSTVRRLCRRYRDYGLVGLYDRRAAGNRKSRWDSTLQDTISNVSRQAESRSTVTRAAHIATIRRKLQIAHPNVAMPSMRTMYRLTDAPNQQHGLEQEAKTRRSKANSPKRMHHQIVSSRLGQYVQGDISPWDILLRSIHHPHEGRRYRLLVFLDHYHRGIVGFSLHAGEPKDVDVVYLLHDILNPKYMMPNWPADMRYPYIGAPENIVLDEHALGPDMQLTAQGFVVPSNITIDNGAVFKSRLFQDACRRLGISVIISRPGTPTDKGAIERFFLTIQQEFAAQLPGYVGRNAAHRGEELPVDQLIWVDEFIEAFVRYYCTVYMKRPHEGLFHPDFPQKKLTPAEMFDVGLRTGGLIRIPLDADIYYQLLPSTERKITPEGVQKNGLKYDHPELDSLRDDGYRYSFSYDPRDLRYLYHRTESGQWLRLHRKPAQFPHLPFTAGMLRAARDASNSNLRHSPQQTSAQLDAIIRDFERQTSKQKRSRPEATAAARLDRVQADRDRTQAPLPIDPPPPTPRTAAPISNRVDQPKFKITRAVNRTTLKDLLDD